MLDPIPPVPRLDRSWEARALTFDDDEISLRTLEDWSKFVSAVHDTEPRFLKKVDFPAAYESALATVVHRIQEDLLETEVDDDELKQHSDDCQTASNVLTTLAFLVGENREEWLELGRRLGARATRLREKAAEIEHDEPEYNAESAPQAFDIAALFADL
jgi:hypothetical protein